MKPPAVLAGVIIVSLVLGLPGRAQERTLSAIEITGNRAFDQETLVRHLRLVKIGATYDPARLETDVETNLKAFLKENGYLQCEVSWEERVNADGSTGVRLKVVEGPQFRLSKLELKGVKAFSPDEAAAQIHLKPGDVLNFGEVKKGLERIQLMYFDKGFMDASYVPDQAIDPATGKAALTFTFDEGTRYKIAYVGIVGCGEQQEEDRVRAVIGLRPGEYFQQSVLEQALAAINKLGLYQQIGEGDCAISPIDEKPGLLSIVFYLKPKTPER